MRRIRVSFSFVEFFNLKRRISVRIQIEIGEKTSCEFNYFDQRFKSEINEEKCRFGRRRKSHYGISDLSVRQWKWKISIRSFLFVLVLEFFMFHTIVSIWKSSVLSFVTPKRMFFVVTFSKNSKKWGKKQTIFRCFEFSFRIFRTKRCTSFERLVKLLKFVTNYR